MCWFKAEILETDLCPGGGGGGVGGKHFPHFLDTFIRQLDDCGFDNQDFVDQFGLKVNTE